MVEDLGIAALIILVCLTVALESGAVMFRRPRPPAMEPVDEELLSSQLSSEDRDWLRAHGATWIQDDDAAPWATIINDYLSTCAKQILNLKKENG